MAALAHGDVVIIPAVDRLSRDTTDLLVIAREMRRRRKTSPARRPNSRQRVARRYFARGLMHEHPVRLNVVYKTGT
jgi:DNA invertase Pin-like site-specific DNA recombinase